MSIFGFMYYWLLRFIIKVLKCGPMPKHVAFILDGNRRFATLKKIDQKSGYLKAINKIEEITKFCVDLQLRELTMYAFSIENTKRKPEEVKTLLHLAEQQGKAFVKSKKTMELGLRKRVIGDIELAPPRLRKIIADCIFKTLNNDKLIMNVAFYYTSRDEITKAIQAIVEGVQSGLLEIDDVNENLISQCLFTNQAINPDIYIRTSGETRMSDFLLWQSGFSDIFFLKPFWPQITIWNLLFTILRYQWNYYQLKRVTDSLPTTACNGRVKLFLENLEKTRLDRFFEYEKIEVGTN